jgi:hypothetical protein
VLHILAGVAICSLSSSLWLHTFRQPGRGGGFQAAATQPLPTYVLPPPWLLVQWPAYGFSQRCPPITVATNMYILEAYKRHPAQLVDWRTHRLTP